jgi:hypothetical protein
MPHPNDINLAFFNCFVPSSFFSGTLVQLLTYLQNLNFKSWLKEGLVIFSTPCEYTVERIQKRLNSLDTLIPFDLTPLVRSEYKKDLRAW